MIAHAAASFVDYLGNRAFVSSWVWWYLLRSFIGMLLALVGSLLASLLSARSYLEQQLSMKNADNASALEIGRAHV